MPDAVLVNFDGYAGPGLPEAKQPRVVPILPLTRYTKKTNPNEANSRKQIPLELAWAISTHKSQGMTIDTQCTVDIGNREIGAGVTYVSLSRVTNVDNLILDFDNTQNYDLDRWYKIASGGQKAFAERNEFCRRLATADRRTLQALGASHPAGGDILRHVSEDPAVSAPTAPRRWTKR